MVWCQTGSKLLPEPRMIYCESNPLLLTLKLKIKTQMSSGKSVWKYEVIFRTKSLCNILRHFCLADTSKCLLTEYPDNQGGLLTTDKNIYTTTANAQSVNCKQLKRPLKLTEMELNHSYMWSVLTHRCPKEWWTRIYFSMLCLIAVFTYPCCYFS